MADQHTRAMIHHLQKSGWSLAQIADFVGLDRGTVLQIVRDHAASDRPRPSASGEQSTLSDTLRMRVSRDVRRLEVFLPLGAVSRPTEDLLAQIRDYCTQLGLAACPTLEELTERMRVCVYGSWLTVLEATPPTPPTPGRIRLLVPVQMAGGRRPGTEVDDMVRRGTVLAQREAGQPGQPGRDVFGHEILPRPLRDASWPQGENTAVSADGTQLVATCDGLVTLRDLRLHVIPMTIHEGDLSADDGVLRPTGGLIVTGSVRAQGAIEASGDIVIQGGVEQAARLVSHTGRIIVRGAIAGAAQQPSELHAHAGITCAQVRHAVLHAGGDIDVQAAVHHSTVHAAGNLRLPQTLDQCLFDVELSLGGGVVAPVVPVNPVAEAPAERRHTRVPLAVDAEIARHGRPPLSFNPCVIEDLSVGGARCRLAGVPTPADLAPDALLQLKFVVPDTTGQCIVMARLTRVAAPDAIGLAFLHITDRDANAVMQFCLQQVRVQAHLPHGSVTDRQQRGAGESES